MKIDEEGSMSDEINDYNEYVKENIHFADELCDKLIEQILFYKFILNSDYNVEDLMNNTVAGNVSKIIENLEYFKHSSMLFNELIDYIKSEERELKWKDFKEMEMDKELLREFNIYKLTKKEK